MKILKLNQTLRNQIQTQIIQVPIMLQLPTLLNQARLHHLQTILVQLQILPQMSQLPQTLHNLTQAHLLIIQVRLHQTHLVILRLLITLPQIRYLLRPHLIAYKIPHLITLKHKISHQLLKRNRQLR